MALIAAKEMLMAFREPVISRFLETHSTRHLVVVSQITEWRNMQNVAALEHP